MKQVNKMFTFVLKTRLWPSTETELMPSPLQTTGMYFNSSRSFFWNTNWDIFHYASWAFLQLIWDIKKLNLPSDTEAIHPVGTNSAYLNPRTIILGLKMFDKHWILMEGKFSTMEQGKFIFSGLSSLQPCPWPFCSH